MQGLWYDKKISSASKARFLLSLFSQRLLPELVRPEPAGELVGYGPDKVAFSATVIARGMKGNFSININ